MDDRPTLGGYLIFIRDEMGITTAQLPDNSVYITTSFRLALHTVAQQICIADQFIYSRAVYNLAGDFLINIAQDPAGAPEVYGHPEMTYFNNLRRTWNIYGFVSGVVSSASDESTSMSLVNPDWMNNMTLSDLQRLKTPFGRAYLEIAMQIGSLWGLS